MPPAFHHVVIVGVNPESAAIFSSLAQRRDLKVVKIFNAEVEDLRDIRLFPQVDIIINTLYDDKTAEALRALNLPDTDVISGLSARFLFCIDRDLPASAGSSEYRTRVLESLLEIQQAVHVAKNKEELLKLILGIAIQSIGGDSGSIMLIDPEKRVLSVEIAHGLRGDVIHAATQKLGKGVAGRVAKTRKPLLITGPVSTGYSGVADRRTEIISSVSCPIILEDEVIGVLNVNSRNADRVFTGQDLEYARTLTGLTADIIETSNRYERSSRNAFTLSTIASVRDIFGLNFPFNERLNLACLRIVNALGAESCKFYEYNPSDQAFITRASSALDLNLLKGRRTKLNKYTTKLVLESDETVRLKTAVAADGTKSWHVAQLIRDDRRILGLLVVQINSVKEELREELAILEKIAEAVGREYGRYNRTETSRIQTIRYSAIAEASVNFSNAQTIHQLAKMIVTNACLILEAEACILRGPDAATGRVCIFDEFAYGQSKNLKLIEQLDDRIVLDVVPSRSVVLCDDLRSSKYAADDLCCTSVVSMALVARDSVIGTLSIYDKRPSGGQEPLQFTPADREVFMSYCLQVVHSLLRFI